MRCHKVTLEPLSIETLEQLRVWRNSHSINRYMDYRQTITHEQQVKWFEQKKKSSDSFYIIRHQSEPIGMTHLDQMDEVKNTAYAGLFIGEKRFQGTGVALSASLLVLEIGFEQLNLNTIYAKVSEQNRVALDYNLAIGFTRDGKESKGFLRLKMDSATYHSNKSRLSSLLTL